MKKAVRRFVAEMFPQAELWKSHFNKDAFLRGFSDNLPE